MYTRKRKHHVWLIPLCVLLLFAQACEVSPSEILQESVSPTESEAEVIIEQPEEEVEEIESESEISPVEEAPPEEIQEEEIIEKEPEEKTLEEIKKLELVKYGFGQEGISASYAFILKNPNQGYSINSSQYQIAAYDANEIVLDTDSGYINLIFPDQTVGIAGSMYLNEGEEISKIEVQIKDGDPETSEQIPTFSTQNVTFFEDDYFSYVTGVIASPYEITLEDIRVSAVLYDAEDNIVGGGYTYLDFLLPNSAAGISFSVEHQGEVSSIELYPILSGLTFLTSKDEKPEDATPLTLLKYGFGKDDYEVGFGFLIENPNSNYSVENSQYHMTGYNADGIVLCTDESYINTIVPDQTLGLAGDCYPHSDGVVDYIEVQIKDGKYVESAILPFFTYENAQFLDDAYFPKITGIIVNPYSIEITNLRVSAIAYDENGAIIGGGYTYMDFIPPEGKAAADVSVTVDGTPASVELYAAITALSELGE